MMIGLTKDQIIEINDNFWKENIQLIATSISESIIPPLTEEAKDATRIAIQISQHLAQVVIPTMFAEILLKNNDSIEQQIKQLISQNQGK